MYKLYINLKMKSFFKDFLKFLEKDFFLYTYDKFQYSKRNDKASRKMPEFLL